jgi:hypothetical protein
MSHKISTDKTPAYVCPDVGDKEKKVFNLDIRKIGSLGFRPRAMIGGESTLSLFMNSFKQKKISGSGLGKKTFQNLFQIVKLLLA